MVNSEQPLHKFPSSVVAHKVQTMVNRTCAHEREDHLQKIAAIGGILGVTFHVTAALSAGDFSGVMENHTLSARLGTPAQAISKPSFQMLAKKCDPTVRRCGPATPSSKPKV
jgi:hypothetical protein